MNGEYITHESYVVVSNELSDSAFNGQLGGHDAAAFSLSVV